jgi:pimeloyl-ACP methyl ester carboxylesterase
LSDVLFLPGIIAPASVRYAPLLAHLGEVTAHVLELAVYASDTLPADYSIDTEVAAITAAADRAGLARFHLCAHSGGGACALAFAAAHPERVISLALDEPASDHSEDDHADPYWREALAVRELPEPEGTATFLRLQLAAGVEPPPRPPGPPPAWMTKRPAGARAFLGAIERYRVDPARYRAIRGPVLFTYGSLSHPRWAAMAARLEAWFDKYRVERFDGLHHLNTSHQAEPARTAALLRAHWLSS